MIANFITFSVLIALSLAIASRLSGRYPNVKFSILRNLIFYHVALSVVYYIYAVFNPSDSWAYYEKILIDYRGPSWLDFYGVSTPFIEFIGYPFVKFLSLPFESLMMIFSWFGLLGFFYFYIFFREKITFRHEFFGFDLLLIIFFLPNLHFWSASLGKGSVIFLGIGLFFYSLNRLRTRIVPLLLGSLIIYHVRPHIFFILLVATAVAFSFSSRGVNIFTRLAVIAASVVAFYYIYEDVMALVGFSEEDFFAESTELSSRVRELTKATSAVDIASYSFPLKLFTFVFRPLFFDAPGLLGLVVSFENLFCILLFIKILRLDFMGYIWKADYTVKSALISFFCVSAALAQISANLGLAIRQKSQVMLLLLFVIIKYMDERKFLQYRAYMRRRRATVRKTELHHVG